MLASLQVASFLLGFLLLFCHDWKKLKYTIWGGIHHEYTLLARAKLGKDEVYTSCINDLNYQALLYQTVVILHLHKWIWPRWVDPSMLLHCVVGAFTGGVSWALRCHVRWCIGMACHFSSSAVNAVIEGWYATPFILAMTAVTPDCDLWHLNHQNSNSLHNPSHRNNTTMQRTSS